MDGWIRSRFRSIRIVSRPVADAGFRACFRETRLGRFRPLIPPRDGHEITVETFRPFTKRAARIPTV